MSVRVAERREIDGTYSNIIGYKVSCVERIREKWPDTIEQDENSARNSSVGSLEPLSVRLVRVAWVVSVEHSSLSL